MTMTAPGADAENATAPRVSIIVPAFNEERHMPQVFTCLARQTYPAALFEVIVVDNGSTDGTVAVAESFSDRLGLRVVSKTGGSIADVRNHGAALAMGEVLVFLDADCFPCLDWLERAMRHGSADLLWGAHYRVPADATWVGRVWEEFQAQQPEGPTTFIPSGNLFLYKTAFERIGKFSAALETSEDVELCQRARRHGLRIEAFTELGVDHAGTPRTLKRFYLQNRWHGKHVLRMFLKNLPSTTHLAVVALSVYTLIMFWMSVAGAVLAVVYRHELLFWLPLTLLLLPPLLLALSKAIPQRRMTAVPELSVLYAVYLLARAAALLQSPARNHR